jgi:hypothetical protein
VSAPRDFWVSCGHHLLDRDASGNLLLTDEFIKAYLARPELVPPPAACRAERKLHAALLRDPKLPVAASQLATIVDADARENWQMMIGWRDHLVKHRTLEAAYLDIVRNNIKFPHVLIGQLVQVILRNLLDDCDDVFVLRAAEMFFRPQRLLVQQGSVAAIDEEREAMLPSQLRSPLVELLRLPASIEVDILNDAIAGSYWQRSDRFDMALDLTAGQRGLDALGDAVGRWLRHLLAIDVIVEPLSEVHHAGLSWYVGLSSEATRMGDTIWNGGELDEVMRARLVGLFRLVFREPADMIEKVRGEPVYLFVAMAPDGVLRLKPQNLLTGLPIRQQEVVN